MVTNLAFLAFFKYAGIFTGLLPAGWIPLAARDSIRAIPLPIGISFYTFHALSLVIASTAARSARRPGAASASRAGGG